MGALTTEKDALDAWLANPAAYAEAAREELKRRSRDKGSFCGSSRGSKRSGWKWPSSWNASRSTRGLNSPRARAGFGGSAMIPRRWMPSRHFSMLREFHLADFLTLANAACGVAGVFCAMAYRKQGTIAYFSWAAALAPAALAFDVLDGRVARWHQQHSALGASSTRSPT